MVHDHQNVSAEAVIAGIRQADEAQIGEIRKAVMQRCKALFPNSEILFLDLPKHDLAERERLLDQMIVWLKTEMRRNNK